RLPCRCQEGKVPWGDLRYDADGFSKREVEHAFAHRNGLAEVLIHGAAVIVEHTRRRLDLISRIRDGFAAATRLDLGDGVEFTADAVRDGPQYAPTFERRQSRPRALVEGTAGGPRGAVARPAGRPRHPARALAPGPALLP